MESIGWGLIGALLLQAFYAITRSRWPESYVTLSDLTGISGSRKLWQYLLFRLGPVYLATVLISETVRRLDGRPVVTAVTLTLFHVGATNGRAILWRLRNLRLPRTRNVLLFHFGVLLTISITVWLGIVTAVFWKGLIPSPSEVVASMWTGLFAALVATVAQQSLRRHNDSSGLVELARKEVGEDLWQYAEDAAMTHSCDPTLIRAIMLAEVLQRPLWMRRAERLKSIVSRSGSYGVTQEFSDHPLSDREAIELTARRFAGYFPERDDYGERIRARMEAAIEDHNYDAGFVRNVMDIYSELDSHPIADSDVRGPDGRAIIEVLSLKREGRTWLIDGTAVANTGHVFYLATDGSGEVTSAGMKASRMAPNRGTWSLELPLSMRSFDSFLHRLVRSPIRRSS